MTVPRTLVAAAALTLVFGVPAAQAQHRGGGGGQSRGSGGESHGGGGHSAPRSGSAPRAGGAVRPAAPRSDSAPRTYAAPRAYNAPAAPRTYNAPAAPRTYNAPAAPRTYNAPAAPRTYNAPAAPRTYNAPRAYGAERGVASPRAYAVAPRANAYGGSRAYGPAVRGYGGTRGGPRAYYGSRFGHVAPARFFRPYYVFRPHLNLGFGLWLGFPFAYYDSYYYPYYDAGVYGYDYGYPPAYSYPGYDYPYPAAGYPADPASSYPPSAYPPSAYPPAEYPSTYPQSPSSSGGAVGVAPGQDPANTGGVSFEITPGSAEIFVDGSLVGRAEDFGSSRQPLGLPAGRHHIEIRATGYRTMSFDADIVAGQVLPYQGSMQR